ncbi:MAG: nucleotide exchange factor GrpE [Chloroflexota bacterium]
MVNLFDPLSDPRDIRKRQVVTRPVNNRRVSDVHQALRLNQELRLKIEELQRFASEQAQVIEAQKEQLQIRSDAIRQQTEDIKKLDTELLWTRAAFEESQAKSQAKSSSPKESEWQERYERLRAEMDNMRRRFEQRTKNEAREDRNRILTDMLPLADHLELALQHADEYLEAYGNRSLDSFLGNLKATQGAFLSTLKRYDIVPIDAHGKPFDPTKHEAIGRIQDASLPAGAIAKVIQTGYMDGERLLRPSKVMVNDG